MLRNKKGLSQLADIILSILLFTIFFVLIMIIGSGRVMQVYATVESANTVLLCQNDINAVMEFPSGDIKIKEALVGDYLQNDYSNFEKEIRGYFDAHAPGQGKWEISILQEDANYEKPRVLYEFGNITESKKNSQTCNYFIPLPCGEVIEKCVMEVQLELIP